MTSPMKPWEINQNKFGSGTFSRNQWWNSNNCSSINSSELPGNIPSTSTGDRNMFPPPVPPRPNEQNSQLTRYTGFNCNNFSPYNTFSSGFPMYSSGYGFGNRFGYNSDFYNNGIDSGFVRLAEESSRPAFQSIESIVQAVASVSMMLESTYHAVYSSFRAVLGVAEHFSRLRTHLAQIMSTLAVIRTLHWLYKRLLYLLGLLKENPTTEHAWYNAEKASGSCPMNENDLKQSRSSWPIIMYFGVVFGAPWLIWKLLNSIVSGRNADINHWATKDDDHYLGVAQYNFQAEGPQELSIQAGQEVVLAQRNLQPKIKGWLLASTDGKKTGLVPANYIKILGFRRGLKCQNQNTDLSISSVEKSNNAKLEDSHLSNEINIPDKNNPI